MTKARDLANAGTALTTVSATELGYVDGVTSAIQTQMDAKLATATASSTYIPKTLTTTTGDIIYASGANTPARLGIGSAGQVLTVTAGAPAWVAAGAFTQISTTTLSGTSVTLSSIPQTYKQLYLSIVNAVGSSTVSVNVTPLRTDGYGDNQSYYTGQYNNDGGAASVTSARGNIPMTPAGAVRSSIGINTFSINFYNYTSQRATFDATSGYQLDSAVRISAHAHGMFDMSQIAGITISGGTYSGGTVTLYGVN